MPAPLLWKGVLFDITTDQLPSHNRLKAIPDNTMETVCKQLLSTYVTENSLPFANMLRSNWEILKKIYENKPLQDYLFMLLKKDDLNSFCPDNDVVDSINRYSPLGLLNKSMQYAYLLNYSYLDSPNHSLSSTKKFFTKQIESDSNFTFWVLSKWFYWFMITPQIIQMIYFYGCANC